MDTNRNTANNYQINTFVKGMNSDTSYDMIGADQYLFGLNIRITNNTLLLGDQNPNFTEGVITPVHIGEDLLLYKSEDTKIDRILATASIGDIGVVIIRTHNNLYSYWEVILGSNRIFQYTYKDDETKLDTFSVVLHKEKDDVINLYIADGIHPIIQMNIADSENIPLDIDYLISGRLLPTDRFLLSTTSGRLKTQQVQYTYRFYKKYGAATKLAPLTNKFNVIDPNRNKELGNAEDTRTSIGFELTLNASSLWVDNYNRLLIYRISYIKQNLVPNIYLIYDDVFSSSFSFVDKGDQELQELSLDEFKALDSQIIIPQSIESNQGYLFAGNIKDETTFYINEEEDLPANSSISTEIVKTKVPIDNISAATDTLEYGIDDAQGEYCSIGDYFNLCGVVGADVSYNDIFGSSLLRSLRRDEKYQYGVVYYDKYGARSNVIKLPELTVPQSEIVETLIHDQERVLYAKPVGVKCTVPLNIGREIVGYQIVRCEKTDEYTKNILLVALSRPSRLSRYEQDTDGQKTLPTYRTPYYPNVYLSTLFLYITYLTKGLIENGVHDIWTSYFDYAGTNVENLSVYQIFAPEINILRKDTASQLLASSVSIKPLRFSYLNNSLQNIAAMFETTQGRLDKPGYILTYCQSFYLEESKYNIRIAQSHSFGNIVDISYNLTNNQQTRDNLIVQLFIPSGYRVVRAYFYVTNTNTLYEDLDVVERDQFVYDFGTNPDRQLYTYYAIGVEDGVSFDTGEVLRLELEERQLSIGTHLLDITGTSSLFSSLESDLNLLMHRIGDDGTGDNVFLSTRSRQQSKREDKAGHNVLIKLYSNSQFNSNNDSVNIENIGEVKNPNWDQGFSSVQIGGTDGRVQSAIKLYKSFTSNVGNLSFVNWVANGMYDFAATEQESTILLGNTGNDFVFHIRDERWDDIEKGWIGPGPVSLLINTEIPESNVLVLQITDGNDNSRFGTIVGNIQHQRLDYNDKYTQYYGFGNFRSVNDGDTTIVFDGDIYITPAEFTNMFKTYDFNDQKATLMSGQTVYYIPMESRINTFFDYGMNYRNTSSTNLMLEPGEITGIASQARPLHLYNMIYSDNNTSVDVFSPQIQEDADLLNHIPHRICFSQLKTDGENIDNWLIFKPIDFIDVDSKYGDITHLLTSDNTLYYWLNTAFGKLSVNERSLVKDENSNAIQLGTGGVLNRYDYLSTRYGMRKDDRAAISAEHGIYWIDVNNKAIPACLENNVVNFSEICNVQNLVNQRMGDGIPTIDYDLLNYELLCGILNGVELVFNIKLRCATSIYTRNYKKCIDINNKLLCINIGEDTIDNIICPALIKYRQINYLSTEGNSLLTPTMLKFAINQSASITKVFDNQKVVTLSKNGQEAEEYESGYLKSKTFWNKNGSYQTQYVDDREYEFKTDIRTTSNKPNAITDREGNIVYDIPRIGSNDWGDRIRGKWMVETIVNNNPNEDHCVSHIITKFRQSYS